MTILKLHWIIKCEIFNEHDEVHGKDRFQIKDIDCLVTSTVADSGFSRLERQPIILAIFS